MCEIMTGFLGTVPTIGQVLSMLFLHTLSLQSYEVDTSIPIS